MGINRYSTTGTTEYTPQHVPLPFDTITKMGEQVKLEHDTADAALAAEKFNIQPGLRTVKHAEELNAKKNALLAEAQARAEKTQNYGRLTQDVKEIGSIIKNDPKWQGIQRDIAQTERANKQRFDPNFKDAVQGYADENGNIIQLESDQAFDENQYNVIVPGNTNAEYKPLFDQIHTQTERIFKNPVTTEEMDDNGRIIHRTVQEGEEAEYIRRDMVKELLRKQIELDPNALNKQSRYYADALAKKQKRPYTKENHLDDIANSYMGEFYNKKDIQKISTNVTAPTAESKARAAARAGGGNLKTPIEVPNQFLFLGDAKQTQATTPVLKDLGYAPGPADLPGSYMVNVNNTDGKGAIINFAKVTADNPQANNIVTYGRELNNLRKTTGIEDNDMFVEKLHNITPKTLYRVKNGKLELFNLDKHPGTKLTQEEFQDKGGDIMHMSDVSVPVDIMKESYLKTTDDFKLLADEAKENGVDISDPKFRDNYLKTLNISTIKQAQVAGQMLDISGNYPFFLNDGNNKTNVGDKAFLDGYIVMTRAQIDAEMEAKGYTTEVGFQGPFDELYKDDWEDVFGPKGNGMIQPYSLTREKEGDAQEQFKIPVKKPIQISQIANQNYNSSFYGTTVTGDESQKWADSFDVWKQKNLIERKNKIYGQSYTNNPTTFKNNIVADISSDRNINADVKGELFNIINELENDPKATKETWVGFKNALSLDGAEEILKRYKNNGVVAQPPATVGKSQGGWSQTPATPLTK